MTAFGSVTSRLTVGAVVGAMLLGAGPAMADPPGPEPAPAPAPPNCTAADLARVSGDVATASSAYLYGHPDVNDFFTSLKGQERPEMRDKVQVFMDANPQVHTDMRAIRQPLTDFQNRCDIAADPLID